LAVGVTRHRRTETDTQNQKMSQCLQLLKSFRSDIFRAGKNNQQIQFKIIIQANFKYFKNNCSEHVGFTKKKKKKKQPNEKMNTETEKTITVHIRKKHANQRQSN
jgi:hypothetical protein